MIETPAPGRLKLRFLWAVVAPHRARAVFVMLLMIVDTALATLGISMILPVLQVMIEPAGGSRIVDRLLPWLAGMDPTRRLLWLCGLTAAVFVVKGIVAIVTSAFTRDFSERMRVYWVSRIGERYLHGPYGRLAAQKQGVLLNNWINEPAAGARFFLVYLGYLASLILTIVLIAIGFLVNWMAMAALLATAAILGLLFRRQTFGQSASLGTKKVRLHQRLTAGMNENLANARDIKVLTAEAPRLASLSEISGALKSVFVRSAVIGGAPQLLGETIAVMAMMGLIAAGVAFFNTQPRDILPLLAFFFVAFYRLITSATMVATGRMKALNDFHSVEVVHALCTAPHDDEDLDAGVPIETLETPIAFRNVTFSYDGVTPVVQDLTLDVPRGQVIFLVGPSGAGKSTLLDLMMRLRTPMSGVMQANGRDIAGFTLRHWRRCFGYVSQEAALFNGSIRMNLELARPGATHAEIAEACRLAGAHEFIAAFPDGYETVVGDRGQSLSGGQRKRVAIARALLRNPSVLILDEATTSFEESLERRMIQDLRAARPGITIIQVTHRLRTARGADSIIVMSPDGTAASGEWESLRHRFPELMQQEEAAVVPEQP